MQVANGAHYRSMEMRHIVTKREVIVNPLSSPPRPVKTKSKGNVIRGKENNQKGSKSDDTMRRNMG